jgi:putative transposase
MNRGRNHDLIFFDDDDAVDFLDTIGDTIEHYGIEVHAYSLMPTHYHLLVRFPLGNLSDAMKHLGAV